MGKQGRNSESFFFSFFGKAGFSVAALHTAPQW
jgi:hypothetical protein